MSHNQDLGKALELISKKQSRIDQLQAENAELNKKVDFWDKCWSKKVKRLESKNAELKAERDKYKSIVEGLPNIDNIVKTITAEYEKGCDNGDMISLIIINIAKAIHKLIHKGE